MVTEIVLPDQVIVDTAGANICGLRPSTFTTSCNQRSLTGNLIPQGNENERKMAAGLAASGESIHLGNLDGYRHEVPAFT